MSSQPPPQAFAHLVNLADDLTGTFVVSASDDYFAPKENLVRPDAPVWREGEYTDRGKWMDGWESQRKREPGHDHCTLRLGTPGRVHGLLVDTTWFKGNAPQAVSLQVTEAPWTATPRELDAAEWVEALPHTPVQPHTPNVVALPAPSGRATHVRLHIYPDGGVARLRVYGEVLPEPRTFWRAGAVDLLALENGGAVAAASDQFFGPPANLLLPGRGTNMGDGWETRRRRTPGSDWCVLRLGRRGVLDRIELDTHFFKGNAPQAALIEALDAEALPAGALEPLLRGDPSPHGGDWIALVGKTPLVQHRRHVLEPERPLPVTHLRVHMFPHGGINRLRAFGHALDTPAERAVLAAFNAAPEAEAAERLRAFNGSRAWGRALVAARPFADLRALFAAAEAAWWALGPDDWLEAFAAHPRIGESKAAPTQGAQAAAWSREEQRGAAGAEEQVKARLAELNARYAEKFGFIYIVFASGKSAALMLELLEERLGRTRDQELEQAAREQAKITRLRLEKWLLAQLEGSR